MSFVMNIKKFSLDLKIKEKEGKKGRGSWEEKKDRYTLPMMDTYLAQQFS